MTHKIEPSISRRYSADDSMATLITDNYSLIHVMTRFGIKVGFGDKTVKEVCEEFGVDTDTFLTVVNFVSEGFSSFDISHQVSLPSLLQYLRQSHIYFLQYSLPAIRKKLSEAIKQRPTDVSFLIIKCFDEYYNEVRHHMEFEEETVFEHVKNLMDGKKNSSFVLSTYSDHHEQVGAQLGELKKILIKYCPEDADPNLINDALYGMYQCEQELDNHCHVEDCLLVPAIKRLEQNLKGGHAND